MMAFDVVQGMRIENPKTDPIQILNFFQSGNDHRESDG